MKKNYPRKMKKSIVSLLLLFTVTSLLAQQKDEVLIRAYYMGTYKSVVEQKQTSKEEFVLDVTAGQSAFYSRWDAEYNRITDSVSAKGGTVAEVLNATSKIPMAKLHYWVLKNHPEKGSLTYHDQIVKSFHYQEKMETPQWNILPQDSLVLGYSCQAAQCEYRGRTWKVWFTGEIPSSEGPWKLHGLPGLILLAEDSTGDFGFECIELKNGNGMELQLPSTKESIKCSRSELMNLRREACEDPSRFAVKMGGMGGGTDAMGRPIKYPKRTALFLDNE